MNILSYITFLQDPCKMTMKTSFDGGKNPNHVTLKNFHVFKSLIL